MKRILIAALFSAATALSSYAADEGLNPDLLTQPVQKEWPTFNGDYTGRRYSELSQINQANVNHMTLAWVLPIRSADIKSMPLEVNGILYFSTPNNVWAADARTGQQIWHYSRQSGGDHIGNRGVGMWKDTLFFETPDCRLFALNAKDGTVRWDIELADPKLGYFATMAPLIIRNHVIVGVSGDVTDIPGLSDVCRSGDRQKAMAMEHGTGHRRTRCRYLAAWDRCYQARRRHDLDDRHL